MDDIQFRIEGDNSGILATSLSEFVKKEWGIDAKSKPISETEAKIGDKDWGTGIGIGLGILGVITNIPGFLNSKMVSSLAWRMGTKESLEKLIIWLEKQPSEQKASISLDINNEQIQLDLEHLTEMLDALQEKGFGKINDNNN